MKPLNEYASSLTSFIKEHLEIKLKSIIDVFDCLSNIFDTDLRKLKCNGEKPMLIEEIIKFIKANDSSDKKTLSEDDIILQTCTSKIGDNYIYVYIYVPIKSNYPLFVMCKPIKGRKWKIFKSVTLNIITNPYKSDNADIHYCSFKLTSEIQSYIDLIEKKITIIPSKSPLQFILDILNGGEISESELKKYKKYINDNFIKPNKIRSIDKLKFESSDPEYWNDISDIKINKNESIQSFISDNKIDGVEIEDFSSIKVINNSLYITNSISYGGDYFDLKISI